MSLPPQHSHHWDISAGGYEFGWGTSPDAAISKEPTKHSTATTTFSPALIAIVAVLGSALLVVSYYKIFVKYCKASRWRPSFRRRRRSLDFEENIQVDAYSLEGFQDPEGWQIITHSYGLDEAVIRSIPLCRFTKAEKLIDSMECAVCLVEFQENEALRLLPKCSHAFHINCIDVWLRSHANCPLCRANIVYVESPFVPAMASRIRPSLEHGMAGVVHDSFRSEDSAAIGAYNAARSSAERMNNVDFQDIVDTGLQCTGLDLEAEGSEHADGLNTRSIILELGGDETIAGSKGDPIMENGPLSELLPTLSRSYSFGSSGNEHYNFTSRDSRTHLLDSLPVTDSTASPWRYRRTFRWSKRFSSPFNSKGRFSLSKDSRGSSTPDASKGRVSNEEDLISKLSDPSISPSTVDMLQLCSSEQVPTKARSIKRQKVSEVEHGFEQRSLPMPEGRHLGEFLSGRGSSSSRDDDVDESGKSYWSLRGSGSDSVRIRTDRSIEEAGELDPSLAVERDRFSKSYSFSERSSFIHQQESGRWPPGFGGPHGRDSVSQNERIYPYGRSRSMYHLREMESSMYRANRWEGTKRQREWPSARVSQADEYFRLHNLKAKLSSAPVKGAPSVDEEVSKNVEREEVSEEKVSVKKDLNEIVTSKAVFSDSGSKEEGPLSAGSKIIDEKVDLNIQTAEDNEDLNDFASEKQKACVQIANLLTRIHKGSSDEVSKPVLEEECPIEGSQKNEGKVLDAETELNAAEKDEGSIHTFFLDLLRGYPNLRKLYQCQDNSKGFDCLVCLSSSPINEMKFSSLVNLLKHTKDGNETLLIHKGYGHAICDLLELDNSNSLSKDVESNELQTEQPLPNEEGTGNTTEPESPSLEGAKSDGPEE